MTLEAPVGIGGWAPHPARGPITALRVLGHNVEISLAADRAQRLGAIAGDYLTFQGMSVLALDARTHQLIPALTAFCGMDAPNEVDAALTAVLWHPPIFLYGTHTDDVVELARTIHDHSIRQGFPFFAVPRVARSNAAIEALCTEAGCGTMFLDLTRPIRLPPTFVRHLFSEHFHLWTIAVAQVAKDARRCFGSGMEFAPVCELGFRGRRATQPRQRSRSPRSDGERHQGTGRDGARPRPAR